MMNILIKRSSIASKISNRTLAALASVQSRHHLHHAPSSVATEPVEVARNGAFGCQISGASSRFRASGSNNIGVRNFHVGSGPLYFKASVIAQAEYATVRDISYEDAAPKGSCSDDCLEISNLGIARCIESALAKKGITKLLPIQKAVVEPAMQGRDLIVRAKTGTGEAHAFGIPIMDKIIQYNSKYRCKGKKPLALVLVPTIELACQFQEELYESAPMHELHIIYVYGGTPISTHMIHLDYGAQIIVGKPGRVIELIKRCPSVLSEVQFLVLYEADQMLDEDVEVILDKLPRKRRQSMMFSATMPTWIKKFTQKHLKIPLTIDLRKMDEMRNTQDDEPDTEQLTEDQIYEKSMSDKSGRVKCMVRNITPTQFYGDRREREHNDREEVAALRAQLQQIENKIEKSNVSHNKAIHDLTTQVKFLMSLV